MESARPVVLLRIALLVLCVGYSVTASHANEPAVEGLTLEQALELAFAKSPELRAFQAQVDEAEGGLIQAGVYLYNPELSVGAGNRSSTKRLPSWPMWQTPPPRPRPNKAWFPAPFHAPRSSGGCSHRSLWILITSTRQFSWNRVTR